MANQKRINSLISQAAAFDKLAQSGGRTLYEVQRTPALELEAHVADPDNYKEEFDA